MLLAGTEGFPASQSSTGLLADQHRPRKGQSNARSSTQPGEEPELGRTREAMSYGEQFTVKCAQLSHRTAEDMSGDLVTARVWVPLGD